MKRRGLQPGFGVRMGGDHEAETPRTAGLSDVPGDRPGLRSEGTRRRCRLAGDERDHGLGHLLADVVGGVLLVGPADLADHDDAVRVVILLERTTQGNKYSF